MGWKYFDFGDDDASAWMGLRIKIRGLGCRGRLRVYADSPDGEEIGCAEFGSGDAVLSTKTKLLKGRHAIFFRAEAGYEGWFADSMKGRHLLELEKFVFIK